MKREIWHRVSRFKILPGEARSGARGGGGVVRDGDSSFLE